MKITNCRLDFLQAIASYLPAMSKGVEIGVLHGDFSQMILDIIKPQKLILIDPYTNDTTQVYGRELDHISVMYSTEKDYKKVVKRFANEIKTGRVVIEKKTSYDAVSDYIDKAFDFFYVDGCHLYDCVDRDLNDWYPKVKSGGLIMGHDYFDFDNFGVKQAVDELMKVYGLEMFVLDEVSHDFAIIKR